MQQADIVIRQILMLGILGLVGYAAGRTKYIPESFGTVLASLVFKITAPLLILTTMANYAITDDTIRDGAIIYVTGFVLVLLIFLFSAPVAKAMKLPDQSSGMYRLLFTFGNVVMLAFPIMYSLFGDKGVLYAIFFNLANDTLLWTVGVRQISKNKTGSSFGSLKSLFNSNTLAFVVGLILILINFQGILAEHPTMQKIYLVFYDALNPMGKATIYLSVFFIGIFLSNIRISSFQEFLKRTPIFLLAVFKLILIPLAVLLILNTFAVYADKFVKTVILIQLAMPSAAIIPALAVQYDADYKFASEGILITTVIGIFTLPFVVYLAGILIK